MAVRDESQGAPRRWGRNPREGALRKASVKIKWGVTDKDWRVMNFILEAKQSSCLSVGM